MPHPIIVSSGSYQDPEPEITLLSISGSGRIRSIGVDSNSLDDSKLWVKLSIDGHEVMEKTITDTVYIDVRFEEEITILGSSSELREYVWISGVLDDGTTVENIDLKDDLQNELTNIIENNKSWRFRSWMWRIFAFIIGIIVGLVPSFVF